MLTFTGELLNVNTSQDGQSTNLIFETESWDRQLRRNVPRAFSILVMKEHAQEVKSYQTAKGSIVTIPCEPRVSKGGQLWYGTAGDGRLMVD